MSIKDKIEEGKGELRGNALNLHLDNVLKCNTKLIEKIRDDVLAKLKNATTAKDPDLVKMRMALSEFYKGADKYNDIALEHIGAINDMYYHIAKGGMYLLRYCKSLDFEVDGRSVRRDVDAFDKSHVYSNGLDRHPNLIPHEMWQPKRRNQMTRLENVTYVDDNDTDPIDHHVNIRVAPVLEWNYRLIDEIDGEIQERIKRGGGKSLDPADKIGKKVELQLAQYYDNYERNLEFIEKQKKALAEYYNELVAKPGLKLIELADELGFISAIKIKSAYRKRKTSKPKSKSTSKPKPKSKPKSKSKSKSTIRSGNSQGKAIIKGMNNISRITLRKFK